MSAVDVAILLGVFLVILAIAIPHYREAVALRAETEEREAAIAAAEREDQGRQMPGDARPTPRDSDHHADRD